MKKILIQFGILTLCIFATHDVSASILGWTQKANFGGVGRHRGTGISIGTKGYMGLGHYNGAGPNIVKKDWWEYDPATNAWTQRADYTGNNGNGNYACVAFGMGDYGYVGGGQVGVNSDFVRFDPSTNTWTPMANLPAYLANNEAFAIGTKGYAMSGTQLWEYNSQTNAWTLKNPMPFNVSTWNSNFVIEGKAFVKNSSTLWEYNPVLDQWANRASFTGLATGGSASFSHFGKGYIVAGYSGALSAVQSELWEFDPATNVWTQLPDFPGTARRFCSAFSIGDRAYFGIGTNGTNFNDFWEFNVNLVSANVDDLYADIQFSIGPNPAIDFVQFSSEKLSDFTVVVYNMSGQEIASIEASNNTCVLNRNGLPAGTYLCKVIKDDRAIHTQRFIFN